MFTLHHACGHDSTWPKPPPTRCDTPQCPKCLTLHFPADNADDKAAFEQARQQPKQGD